MGDPDERAILVEAQSRSDLGVLRLPSVELPFRADPPITALLAALTERLGAPIVPLRFRPDRTGVSDSGCVIFHIEPQAATAGWRFAGADQVRAGLGTMEPAEARDEVRWWLDRLDRPADAREAAWTRPGWFARAATWTIDRLTEAGFAPTEPPRVVYQDILGTILRTRSGQRATFMKCPVRYFRSEATITAALSRRVPDRVPEVLAIEPTEDWLLMGDVGERILGKQPEATWADGLRQFPALQRAWVGHTEELSGAGALVRPVSALADALPGFLDREALGDRLEPDVLARWVEAIPRLVDACHRLDDIGLPETVVHGDLHPWNVAVNDAGMRVFDWSDGAVGHPFLDLAVFIRRAKDESVRATLREAYIDGWSDVMPRDRLETAVDLAMTVGALYQVETYLRLLPAIDPHDVVGFHNADARWLGRALDGLPGL